MAQNHFLDAAMGRPVQGPSRDLINKSSLESTIHFPNDLPFNGHNAITEI